MAERVIYTQDDGTMAVIVPAPGFTGADVMKDVPAGKTGTIVDHTTLPADRMFRAAWVENLGVSSTDLPKAKLVAHDMRRYDRTTKLTPLDDQINWAVGDTTLQNSLEAQRATIRAANATTQINIDTAADETALRTVLTTELG